MSETALALTVIEVEDHVVVVLGAGSHGDSIKVQFVTNLPGDHVICAGSVAAEPEDADDLAVILIQGETARKYDDAANGFADHRVIWCAERRGISEDVCRIGWRAGGKRVQALSGLSGSIDVGG